VFNREVITVSGSAEAVAYGAALVAGSGVGVWSSVEEAVQVVRVETRNDPIAENFKIYNKPSRSIGIFTGRWRAVLIELPISALDTRVPEIPGL